MIADATKRFESAKELMESKRASSNRAAADASAAEAARAEAAADRKAAEAALTKCAQMQDAANRVAAAEAAAADSAATNVALREEVSALNGGCCAALETVAEAAEIQCAELQAAVKVAEQRAVAAEQRVMQNSGKGGRGGRGPPWPSAPRSNFDQSARIARWNQGLQQLGELLRRVLIVTKSSCMDASTQRMTMERRQPMGLSVRSKKVWDIH